MYHVRSSQFRVRGRPGIDILKDVHWFIDSRRAGGGALIDIGVYQIDVLLWLLGNPRVKTVLCTTKMGIGDPAPAPLKQDVEDHAVVMFTCENGASGILEITWSSNISGADALLVFGTKGGPALRPPDLHRAGADQSPARAGGARPPAATSRTATRTASAASLSSSSTPCSPGASPTPRRGTALEVTRVMHAAYESAKTGQAVQLT